MQPNCQRYVKCLFLEEPLILTSWSRTPTQIISLLEIEIVEVILSPSLTHSFSLSPPQGSDSEYEVDPNRQKTHSFVNHYISDPTYYNSWRRQQKGISRVQAYNCTESESGEPEPCAPPPPLPPLPPLPPFPPQLSSPTPQSQSQTGSMFRPKGSRTPTPSQQISNSPSQHGTLYRPPSSLAPGSRAPIAGFSSFVW